MNDSDVRIARIEGEVLRLTNTNRRMLRFFIAACAVCLLPWLLGLASAAGRQDKVVQVERLEVVREGKVLASLSSDDDGGLLMLRDEDGNKAAQVAVDPNGAGWFGAFKNRDRQILAIGGIGTSGGGVRLNHDDGSPAVVVSAVPSTGGRLTLFDRNNKVSVQATAGETGQIVVCRAAQAIVDITGTQYGPWISLHNDLKQEKPTMVLWGDKYGGHIATHTNDKAPR